MNRLVDGDDGMLVDEVGRWAETKHDSIRRYVAISSGVRLKWIAPTGAGATYIDLFSGPGRSRVRKTGRLIEGSCVAAWRESVRVGAPFSQVYIADADPVRRKLASERLKRLGAPVVEVQGSALEAAASLKNTLPASALHFAFIDPYNLRAFSFDVVRSLSQFRYIDMLVHISKMDLQRNVGLNIGEQESAFDHFAPGWRDVVNTNQSFNGIRQEVFQHWCRLIANLGVFPSADMQLVRGSRNQPLYWLTLAARHELAHRFWQIASRSDEQGKLL